MGDGIHNPYTRKDILRLIKENGGTTKGLDLSGAIFEENVDLSGLDLSGIILNGTTFHVKHVNGKSFGAKFNGSNLKGAKLYGAFLTHADFGCLVEKTTTLHSADLRNAQLQHSCFESADLSYAQLQAEVHNNNPVTSVGGANFRNATFYHANLKGCDCLMAKFEGAYIRSSNIMEAILEDVDWGDYFIGEENGHHYYFAEQCYRQLKTWYKQSGYDDIAAKFYYREKEVSRIAATRRRDRVAGWLSWAVFGHGERWRRILIWIAGIVLLFTMVYFIAGLSWQWVALGRSLYFSAVSFTALGYGSWLWTDNNIIRGIGAAESFLGVFMMALLLVTFVRKWTR